MRSTNESELGQHRGPERDVVWHRSHDPEGACDIGQTRDSISGGTQTKSADWKAFQLELTWCELREHEVVDPVSTAISQERPATHPLEAGQLFRGLPTTRSAAAPGLRRRSSCPAWSRRVVAESRERLHQRDGCGHGLSPTPATAALAERSGPTRTAREAINSTTSRASCSVRAAEWEKLKSTIQGSSSTVQDDVRRMQGPVGNRAARRRLPVPRRLEDRVGQVLRRCWFERSPLDQLHGQHTGTVDGRRDAIDFAVSPDVAPAGHQAEQRLVFDRAGDRRRRPGVAHPS